MARITVDDCLKNVKNRFELVHIAAERTRQLEERGDKSLLEGDGDNNTLVALREIAAGHVGNEILENFVNIPSKDGFSSQEEMEKFIQDMAVETIKDREAKALQEKQEEMNKSESGAPKPSGKRRGRPPLVRKEETVENPAALTEAPKTLEDDIKAFLNKDEEQPPQKETLKTSEDESAAEIKNEEK